MTIPYPDDKQVHYEYDAASQLVKVTDWAERVTSYTYDKNGRLKTVTRPNGIKTTRVYNRMGQLVRQYDRVNSFEFSYDAAGNIVTEKTEPEADPNINLEMAYQAANRLATVDEKVVQFDADGNMTRGSLSGELTNFGFDSRNRLVQAGDTVYHYDAENQRIGVNQIQYVVNSQPALSQVLVKTEADGTQAFYVYGLGLIGQESNGKYLSYHFDFRGSTVALTSDTAQVVERFQYSPYGMLVSGDASTTPFLFNGMYGVMSDGNGLYYMRARFYSPEIRRFVNQDVLLGFVAEGQTLNRYAFVTSQPVSFVDPFGLEGLVIGDDNYGPSNGIEIVTAIISILEFIDVISDVASACSVIVSGGSTLAASPVQLGKKAAIKKLIAVLKAYIKNKQGVALDTNAIIAGLEYGDIAKIDAALKGRIPLVSRQAIREFIEGGGNMEALKQFLSKRGGRVASSATENELKALLDSVAKLPAKPSPRKIGKGDKKVLGCALKEGVSLITNDRKLCNLANDLGGKGEKF